MDRNKDDKGAAKTPLTPEIVDKLRWHKLRTGVGSYRLFSGADHVPEGLTWQMVEKWLAGQNKAALSGHVDWVLKRWSALPDCTKPEPDYRPVSEAALAAMHHHRERTGCGPFALLRGATDKPDGLRANLIQTWLAGATKSARRDYLDYVLERWASLPDKST